MEDLEDYEWISKRAYEIYQEKCAAGFSEENGDHSAEENWKAAEYEWLASLYSTGQPKPTTIFGIILNYLRTIYGK